MRTMTTMIGGAVLAAAALVATAAPADATTAAPGYGSLAVQLTNPDGSPLRLAGVEVAATGPSGATSDGYTTASGIVTLGQLYGPATFTVWTETVPQNGAATVAPGRRTGVVVTPGATATTTLTLTTGATVSGSLVGPNGAAAGLTVFALNGTDPSQVFQTTSDPSGAYELDGLGTGTYTIEASATQTSNPAQWKTRVVQQVGAAPPSHVVLSQHYVHSDYDLAVSASAPGRVADPTLSGATVTATRTTDGAAWSTRFSELLDTEQEAQFELPSGTYRLSLVTTGTATAPSRTLWFSAAHTWTTDASQALSVRVAFGYWSGWGGPTE
jgi:hypothetical protein